ncbi:MAG: hypothetical protein IJW40_02405 [Clostridia bacterium]|nr:hypothetical protein [Clostridia bacterium]
MILASRKRIKIGEDADVFVNDVDLTQLCRHWATNADRAGKTERHDEKMSTFSRDT